MAVDPSLERQQAHVLLDQLPPHRLTLIRSLLETLLDPMDRKLALAPADEEPETEEERQAVAEAMVSLQKGGVPMETVLADFGLTMEDFRRMAATDAPPSNQS